MIFRVRIPCQFQSDLDTPKALRLRRRISAVTNHKVREIPHVLGFKLWKRLDTEQYATFGFETQSIPRNFMDPSRRKNAQHRALLEDYLMGSEVMEQLCQILRDVAEEVGWPVTIDSSDYEILYINKQKEDFWMVLKEMKEAI